MWTFAGQWGAIPIPMKWWRDAWMLLPSQQRGGGKVGEGLDELAQTLLVRRLLGQLTELIEELIQKGELARHEVASKLPGILCKGRFSSDRRHELRELCVKYASGMGTVVTKHELEASVVDDALRVLFGSRRQGAGRHHYRPLDLLAQQPFCRGEEAGGRGARERMRASKP